MRAEVLTHEFVEAAPDKLEDGKVYVSIPFATVLHKCCCGCGTEVVTPLSPAEWQITFDGETISLHPSIGNWGLPCGSHYFIDRNRIRWAGRWSPSQIERGRAADRRARRMLHEEKQAASEPMREAAKSESMSASSTTAPPQRGFRRWIERLRARLVG
jgi:hypothetical protein